jgi:hypothetical protein
MAYYAFLNENNIVTEVISGRNENEIIEGISDWETYYGNLRNQVCKRTSCNTIGGIHKTDGTPFRKNFAGQGYVYDQERDAFIAPKPFSKWVLNEDTCCWEAPIPYPTDDKRYIWNDNKSVWEELVTD